MLNPTRLDVGCCMSWTALARLQPWSFLLKFDTIFAGGCARQKRVAVQGQRQNRTSMSTWSSVFSLSLAWLARTTQTLPLPRAFTASFPLAAGLGGRELEMNKIPRNKPGGGAGSLLSRDPPCLVACNWSEHWPLGTTRVRPFPAVAIAMRSFRLFPLPRRSE